MTVLKLIMTLRNKMNSPVMHIYTVNIVSRQIQLVNAKDAV